MQITGGVTHQFASNIYVQADYVASSGKDQIIQRQTNLQLVNGVYLTNDPRYSQFTLYQNIGWTRYDALQMRVQHSGSRLHAGAVKRFSLILRREQIRVPVDLLRG